MSDWLKNIRLHHSEIEWDDPSLNAGILTKKMMGNCGYLKDLTDRQAIEKEIEILSKAGYSKWGGESSEKPYYQHVLTLMKLLMPRRDITLNLADCTMLFCLCLKHQRKFLNMLGCQNSAKSSFLAMLSMTCLAVSPEVTSGYLANPFDAVADSTVWGDTVTVFNSIKQTAPWLWPNAREYKSRSIEVIPGVPKGASIEIRGVKDTGKFKGMKDIKDGDQEPLLLVGIDEVNEVKNQSFIQEVSNLVSQDGFITLTSQNFTKEDNMGGIFARPKALFDGCPGSYTELDKDKDFVWHSHLSGVTIRFDGRFSPNILAKRKIYPYLFNEDNLKTQVENYGEDSPEYYSQVLSFPRTGMDELVVLSYSRRDSSRWKDWQWTIDKEGARFSFCDPSFGGGDKAIWGYGVTGTIWSVGGDGKQRDKHVALWFDKSFVNLKIEVDAKFDDFWMVEAQNAGVDLSQFVKGQPLAIEEQIAIQCRKLNLANNIPPENFGFDFSMRPEVTPTMRDIVGGECVAFDYHGAPHGYWLEHCKKDSKEQITSRRGELAFLVADLFINKQVRGGKHIEEAVAQLCREKYELKGKKWHVESKREYKSRNGGKSPDECDTLKGIVGMAHLRGFRSQTLASGSGDWGVSSKPNNKFLRSTRLNKKLPA